MAIVSNPAVVLLLAAVPLAPSDIAISLYLAVNDSA
jgi:hypothetical protein